MTYTAAELNQTGIYAIINRDNGKAYIGSAARSFRERWDLHKRTLRQNKHRNGHLQNSWNKHTEFRFEFRILEVVPKEEWIDNSYLLDIEQMYLDTYQPEYNIYKIAGSPLGHKHTKEARKKMSESHKDKIVSEETRQKLRDAWKGRTSPRPSPTPEELRKRKAKAAKTKGYKRYKCMSPTGELCITLNLKEYCRQNNISYSMMQKVLCGDKEGWKGWKVKRIP